MRNRKHVETSCIMQISIRWGVSANENIKHWNVLSWISFDVFVYFYLFCFCCCYCLAEVEVERIPAPSTNRKWPEFFRAGREEPSKRVSRNFRESGRPTADKYTTKSRRRISKRNLKIVSNLVAVRKIPVERAAAEVVEEEEEAATDQGRLPRRHISLWHRCWPHAAAAAAASSPDSFSADFGFRIPASVDVFQMAFQRSIDSSKQSSAKHENQTFD